MLSCVNCLTNINDINEKLSPLPRRDYLIEKGDISLQNLWFGFGQAKSTINNCHGFHQVAMFFNILALFLRK